MHVEINIALPIEHRKIIIVYIIIITIISENGTKGYDGRHKIAF